MESMTAIRLRLKKRNKILFQMQRERQHPELSFENMRSYNTVIPSGGRGNTVKSLDEIIEKEVYLAALHQHKKLKIFGPHNNITLLNSLIDKHDPNRKRPGRPPNAKTADEVPLRGRPPNAKTADGVPPNKKEMIEGSVRTRVRRSRRPSHLREDSRDELEPRGRSPNPRTADEVPLERPRTPREKAPDRDSPFPVNL